MIDFANAIPLSLLPQEMTQNHEKHNIFLCNVARLPGEGYEYNRFISRYRFIIDKMRGMAFVTRHLNDFRSGL